MFFWGKEREIFNFMRTYLKICINASTAGSVQRVCADHQELHQDLHRRQAGVARQVGLFLSSLSLTLPIPCSRLDLIFSSLLDS